MKMLRHPLTRWALTVLWMMAIFMFSGQPNSSDSTEHLFGSFNIIVRKLAHVTEYGILFALIHNALDRRSALLTIILSLLYACSDEWHQSFVPGRSATIGDVAVDSIGMVIAWGMIRLLAYSTAARRS